MQYVACKFRPEDKRAYTYEWEGEPLTKGDIVKVPDKSGDGWQRVTVDAISDEAPPFACKPILGLYTPDVEPDADASDESEDATDPFDGVPLPF
ncbi:hypothetical protein [Pelagerythrobacter aerophilus]|uniref:Uncharacterized protein n=1 Tax=Pelagerythrobacter aerophilus TaxID=2306995 RepID=A0A418NK42_9SPHN|nr:hypothetical protein [Pelagerythrobacter aerophilus]RIV79539.1 hypothetical protein D2V04_06095 [Pelagerythrobacter aerophilus]